MIEMSDRPYLHDKVVFRVGGKNVRGTVTSTSHGCGENEVLVHCYDDGNNYILDYNQVTIMDWSK